MDFKDNSNKPKKSILNTLLLKRSTKVEPHPSSSSSYEKEHHDRDHKNSSYDDHPYRPLSSNGQPNLFQTSVSASSTPIKRLHKIGRLNRLWHCHSSTQSLSSNHSAPSHFLRQISTSSKKKIRNKTDRHSHPISCQNVITDDDEQAYDAFFTVDDYIDSDHIDDIGQSPSNKTNNVRFDSNNGRLNVPPRSISNEQFSSTDDNSGVSKITSKSQEQIIVNDIDESIVCDSSEKRSPTSKSHDGNFTFNRDDDFDCPAGHSIAMSACRSRLRERLLPPGYANRRTQSSSEQHQHQQQQQKEQPHYSFPDIVEKSSNSTSSEHRHSRSNSCDLITNAKRTGKTESLAKNSLMAAQLINLNLIPTEVARER